MRAPTVLVGLVAIFAPALMELAAAMSPPPKDARPLSPEMSKLLDEYGRPDKVAAKQVVGRTACSAHLPC